MASLQAVYECPDGTPFPVEWPSAEMAEYGWSWDQMHHTTPLTPLAQGLLHFKADGMTRGSDSTGTVMRNERVIANGYVFGHALPVEPDELAVLAAVAEHDIARRLGRLLELWDTRYRPEVEALTRSLRTWATPEDSLAELAHRFDEVCAIAGRLGELHSIAFGMTNVAMGRFQAFCRAEFGDDGDAMALEAVAGMPNKSLESAEALWQLSRQALARPAVAELLRESPPVEFLAKIDAVEAGPEFRTLLDGFLDIYGQRNESFSELVFPTWREDQRFVIFTLKSYLDAPEEQSPAVMHAKTGSRREARTREARERLNDPERFEAFREAQRIGRQRTILLEDHNHYIDQRGFSTLRMPCLALGERLAAQGSIDAAEDVFYVFRSEIDEAAAEPGRRYQALVSERRVERDRWLRTLPPNVIGNGEVRLNARQVSVFGPLEAEPSAAGEVRGMAASAGVVRGTARVVRTLDEVDRLQRGDILVTYATAPPWTPLFAIASAIVTDAGGPLSHAAVVAREYGIPAVVGTKAATARIEDGMVITVDGTEGVVRIDS